MRFYCPKCKIYKEQYNSECPVCHSRMINQTKIYWSSIHNVPLIIDDEDKVTDDLIYISSDIRPVFPEERLLLELILEKPFSFKNSSVWCAQGGTYIIDGKKIKIVIKDLRNYDSNKIRSEYNRLKEENTYEYFDMFIDRFVSLNRNRMDLLEEEATLYILKQAENYDLKSIFVSFSGGKDSTVVSDLVLKAIGKPNVIHIFGDTTLEFPETYEYVERFKKINHRLTPMFNAKNREKNFYELCEVVGPPSRVMRWCCTVFKTGAITQYTTKMFKNTNRILTFYGIRWSESASRSKYDRDSDSPKIVKQRTASPIIEWLDIDVWLYILKNKIDFNEAYKLGFARVGCWCCPNNSSWSEFLSKIHHPEEYYEFRNILLNNAVKIGKPDPEEYVDSGAWKAKQGGNGIEYGKRQVVSFKPCATDENSFNYELQKPIDDNLFELFKPFGQLNYDLGNKRLNEVYVLNKKNEVILKLQGKIGEKNLKVSIINLPVANAKTIKDAEGKIKCQLTKFQMCLNCSACMQVCRFGAIKIKYENEKLTYRIDENKCVNCSECINHFISGCYLKKILKTKNNE